MKKFIFVFLKKTKNDRPYSLLLYSTGRLFAFLLSHPFCPRHPNCLHPPPLKLSLVPGRVFKVLAHSLVISLQQVPEDWPTTHLQKARIKTTSKPTNHFLPPTRLSLDLNHFDMTRPLRKQLPVTPSVKPVYDAWHTPVSLFWLTYNSWHTYNSWQQISSRHFAKTHLHDFIYHFIYYTWRYA